MGGVGVGGVGGEGKGERKRREGREESVPPPVGFGSNCPELYSVIKHRNCSLILKNNEYPRIKRFLRKF